MTGVVAAGIGIGALIGQPTANWLISAYGWRMASAILGIIVLASVSLSAQLLRRELNRARWAPDKMLASMQTTFY